MVLYFVLSITDNQLTTPQEIEMLYFQDVDKAYGPFPTVEMAHEYMAEIGIAYALPLVDTPIPGAAPPSPEFRAMFAEQTRRIAMPESGKGLQIFEIEQGYNCMNWRAVRVLAADLDSAIEIADDASEGEDEACGVLDCTEWSSDGGGSECGPTFTVKVEVDGHEVDVPRHARQDVVEGHCDLMADALRGALAFVEAHTGNGARDVPAWALLPSGDFNVEEIAKRGRTVLA